MIIKVEIDDVSLAGSDGYAIASTCATCTRCGNASESFGTSEGSVFRCLMLLRESCPGGRRHFYEADDGSPDDRAVLDPPYEGDPTCCFTAAGLVEHRRMAAIYQQETGE